MKLKQHASIRLANDTMFGSPIFPFFFNQRQVKFHYKGKHNKATQPTTKDTNNVGMKGLYQTQTKYNLMSVNITHVTSYSKTSNTLFGRKIMWVH